MIKSTKAVRRQIQLKLTNDIFGYFSRCLGLATEPRKQVGLKISVFVERLYFLALHNVNVKKLFDITVSVIFIFIF